MKKFLLFILLWFLPLGLLIACSSEEEAATPNLTVAKATIDFTNESGVQTVAITTNAATWSAQSDKNWCHPSVSGKLLKIEVDASEERLVREATVAVMAGGLTKDIKVRQLGYEAAILLDQSGFEVNAVGGEIKLSITTNVKVNVTLPEWVHEKVITRAPQMVTTEHTYIVAQSELDNKRQGSIVVTETLSAEEAEQNTPVTTSVLIVQSGLKEYVGGNGEDVEGDVKIKIISGQATSHQGGEDIDKSFDGDYSTIYHSSYSNEGSNYFPITLTYNFAKDEDVDYLIYYPRMDGSYNGRFKEVDILYSEDGSSFKPLMTKDFQGSNSPSRIVFDKQIHAKSFRFIVKSGDGDGQGFATCSEMEFYQKNLEAFDYSTLFTDETCSELKNGIDETQINACQFPFFKNLAYYMLKGKYDSEFRVAEFKAYPTPDIQSKTHKTHAYSLLDNPTGIAVKADETLIVLVGDTRGYDISLKVQNLDCTTDGFGGNTYFIGKGVNKITIREKGLVYVMYHTATLDDVNAEPIKIHFASGTVNGYYDSQNDKLKDRWAELIGKATNKHFDVVGKYAHLTYETIDLKNYAGSNGKKLIDAYDDIVYGEQSLMGLFKYDKAFRNRMYFNVIYTADSYMYATTYHTAYHKGTMSDLCDYTKLTTDACWGPAHEVGHCNQTRPGVMWVGCAEVTNNIMSEYIQTTVFNQPSRIQTEDAGIIYRNRYSKAWTSLIANEGKHGEFESIEDNDDVFCKLVPFWQLELYFGKVLGRTPLQQADKGGFYPTVYEYVRNKDYTTLSNGESQLDFVYNCCVAAKMNLCDFFEKWGFLRVIDRTIDDYGEATLKVTQSMIDVMKSKINSLGYEKPTVALEYISDNTVDLYKNLTTLQRGASATHSPKTFTVTKNNKQVSYTGESITISGWKNVVTYEVKNATGKLIFICSGETTPSNTATFTLPVSWAEGFKLYAVSVTGERTEVPMQ